MTEAPTHEELVRRASDLVPLLRKHALWSEENRRLHEEVIEALGDAGFFKMRVPARYGGYEASTRTVVEVTTELGRGDGSVGWVQQVWWIPGWMVGMFPDEAQEEIYQTPNVRVCGTLSPSATATPTDGGYIVNGKWGFISGALHSHWQEIIAVTPAPDGGMQPIMGLVPVSDVEIIDDWHTMGIRGSGSVTTVAEDLFVPAHRVVPLMDVLQGRHASAHSAELPMYQAPLNAVAAATTVGPVLGMARGAMDAFLERLPGRKITYTSYESQREAPITHLQLAEASLKIDEAEFHSFRVADLLDAKAAEAEPWKIEERARARADVGAVGKLAKEAVDLLSGASGGSSIYESVPIQRIARNVAAANLHALIYPPTAFELYGRVLAGLDPNTLYV